ncbi:MAG: isomerizing glutamine--fructose-6-phosphate transaminase, partial [Cellulosilyticaceae bacterium]
MCGIVGYIGGRSAKDVIVSGLSKLEYRGYDSAGIAINDTEGTLKSSKKKGRLSILAEFLEENPVYGGIGIGHTRWATHGEPSDVNSHPHLNQSETIAVVHNGIIENYMELKEALQKEGYIFKSETDTEVVAHLVDKYYEGDLVDAVYKAVKNLRGAYALGVICQDRPDELVAVRKESPLIVGVGEGEYFIASDIPAILEYTKNVYYIDNDEVVLLTREGISIMNKEREVVDKEVKVIDWDIEAASKNGYDHFMMKEIYDQPIAIRETLIRRLDEKKIIKLDDIK